MRTKEEIAVMLAKRKLPDALNSSTWGDLVASIQSFSNDERAGLVNLIVGGRSKKAGDRLKRALYENARQRAMTEVNQMLDDDNLSIAEIDKLI